MHEAITDLHTFVLVLDADRRRLTKRLDELRDSAADRPARAGLEVMRAETVEAIDALRATIAGLRRLADPAGKLM